MRLAGEVKSGLQAGARSRLDDGLSAKEAMAGAFARLCADLTAAADGETAPDSLLERLRHGAEGQAVWRARHG